MSDLIPLLTSDRRIVIIDEGDSLDVVAVFEDASGAALDKASLNAIEATLYDQSTNSSLNSRNAQSVLDANGGTVASNGTLTLRLDGNDNSIVGDLDPDDVETHILELRWAWNDGVRNRANRDKRTIRVRKRAVVT